MDVFFAFVTATASTAFAIDLVRDLRRGFRPHVAAYGAGIAMFAVASWALASGLAFGWSSASYRTFFLFGAVLNVPFLALGSMFLVSGRRAGHITFLVIGALAAISTTLVTTEPFASALPASGLAEDIFPSGVFGPRLLAAIAGGLSTLVLVTLSVISIARFRKTNRRLVAGNLLILAGTLAAAGGGSALGFLGKTAAFEISLLVAVALIWGGYRVSRGTRRAHDPRRPMIVLVGPSTLSPLRDHTLEVITALEDAGYRVMCPARDIEEWGEVGFSPAVTMQRAFRAIDESSLVVADLADGYGVEVVAGYARAVRVPVVVAAPEGSRISRPLKGVASEEIYYGDAADIVERVIRSATASVPVAHSEAE